MPGRMPDSERLCKPAERKKRNREDECAGQAFTRFVAEFPIAKSSPRDVHAASRSTCRPTQDFFNASPLRPLNRAEARVPERERGIHPAGTSPPPNRAGKFLAHVL